MEVQNPDRIATLLTKFLDVQSKRAEVVSANVANADTPKFKAQRLDFADYLKRLARNATSSDDGELSVGEEPQIVSLNGPARIDGNDVDLAREMADLADSGMQYLSGIQMLQSRLRTLRAAVREGR